MTLWYTGPRQVLYPIVHVPCSTAFAPPSGTVRGAIILLTEGPDRHRLGQRCMRRYRIAYCACPASLEMGRESIFWGLACSLAVDNQLYETRRLVKMDPDNYNDLLEFESQAGEDFSGDEDDYEDITPDLAPIPAKPKQKDESIPIYDCPMCDKEYKSISGFNYHVQTKHSRPDLKGMCF